MQQRRLRLGDILDDYCPRERRITNHAVVAMIEDQVKQTRCTTCDADHEYKEAKLPLPRRKKPGSALDPLDLQGELRPVLAAPTTGARDDQPIDDESFAADADSNGHAEAAGLDPNSEADGAPLDDPSLHDDAALEDAALEDEGPVHRRLIRATLPRPEGQVPERKAPDFTMRQPGRFNNNSRNGQGNRGHRPIRAGQGHSGAQSRFGGGPRQGAGQGAPQGQPRHGNRPGQPSGQRGGRPAGANRGQRHGGGGQGRKRGR